MPCSNIRDLPRVAGAPDLLGIDEYARAIERFVSTADTPMTIAIQGEWGCGKTSMMNLIRSELCEKSDEFHDVWINTWHYALFSDECSAMIKIIKGILDQVLAIVDQNKATPNPSSIAAKRILAGLARGVTRMGAGVVGAGAVADELIKSIPDNPPTVEVTVGDLRNEISNSIKHYITENPGRKGFLIFIDDLDRIEPVTAVNILELLKNIFDIEHCLFILAIDYDVIVKGLKPKFGELTQENEREFRSFFDKIIQLPFSMPVASYKVDGFLLDSLRKIEYFDDQNLNKIEVAQTLSRISNFSVGRNPRAMKRLMNILSLIKIFNSLCENLNAKNDEMHERLINFSLICIQLAYPKIYDLLANNPDFMNEWDTEKALQMGLIENLDSIAVAKKTDGDHSKTEDWEDFLKLYCNQDLHLKLNYDNVVSILKEIINLLPKASEESLAQTLEKLLALSSVTQVSASHAVSSSGAKYQKNYLASLDDWIRARKSEGYTNETLDLAIKFHQLVEDVGNINGIKIIFKYTAMINFYVEGMRKGFALTWITKSGNLNIVLRIGAEEINSVLPMETFKMNAGKGECKGSIGIHQWDEVKPQLEKAFMRILAP